MINSFKYIFVKTTTSWFIGSSHHFLSFSLDGTAIAGTKKAEKRNFGNPFKGLFYGQDHVQVWETATGAATSSFTCSSFVVFSPTDPNLAALVRPGFIHILKRDSFGGKTWGGQYKHQHCEAADTVCTFNSDGTTILRSWNQRYQNGLREYDVTTWSHMQTSPFVYNITTVVRCPIKPGWFVVGDQQGELEVVSNRPVSSSNFRSHGRLIPINPVRISACAWSQDGRWIATGNDDGDTSLWNAGDPACVSFAMLLPRNQLEPNTSNPTTSLVFVPDSTALIIICGGYLSVWDIQKAEYVTDSGLPDTAVNIALDGPRNRLAVAANEKITIYELKLAENSEQMCQMDSDGKWKQLITFKSLLYLTFIVLIKNLPSLFVVSFLLFALVI